MSRHKNSSAGGSEHDARLHDEIRRVMEAVRRGELEVRGNPAGLSETQGETIGLVNAIVGDLVGPLRLASSSLREIAAGTIPEFVIEEFQGEFNDIKKNINNFLATMHGMHHEAQGLIAAVKQGQLGTRGNDWDFSGNWQALIAGMNDVIDAFERPFSECSRVVQRLSAGDLPQPIGGAYRGAHKKLAKDLNELIHNLVSLTGSIRHLTQTAIDGQLDERIASEGFRGDWHELVEGINATLNAALAPVKEAGEVLESMAGYDLAARMQGDYRGAHGRIKEALNTTGETLNRAVLQVASATVRVSADAGSIAEAARGSAEGAETQVEAVGFIAESLEQLAGEARDNAERTEQALWRSNKVKDAAERGNALGDKMVEVMSDVSRSTQASSTILQQIDDLATKTDALATSAAVEAGHVASSGRGFAVVAQEIGSLAKQSKVAVTKLDTLTRSLLAGLRSASSNPADRALAEDTSTAIQEIRQIALQTNMLSLNAAVEAAHVAAASTGFERITAEVRDLAKKAADAAVRTKELTRESVAATENGTGMAQELQKQLGEATASLGDMLGLLGDIARANQVQLGHVEAVTQGMASIQGVAADASAGAQRSSEVARSLAKETTALSTMVGRFRLEEAANDA